TPIALLGAVQNFHGLFLVAIADSPAFELYLGSAAELQQLVPMSLKEIENASDYCVLFPLGLPQSGPAHMDMQAAGAGHMGLVAPLHRPLQHSGPGHLLPVP